MSKNTAPQAGRNKSKPSNQAYIAQDRRARNKKRNIARDARLKEKAKEKFIRRRTKKKPIMGVAP